MGKLELHGCWNTKFIIESGDHFWLDSEYYVF